MSWKCSVRYWPWLDFHVFTHALDPKGRRFYTWRQYQLWPPPWILDWRTEWLIPKGADARQEYIRDLLRTVIQVLQA